MALYIVATPIGNAKDISQRALECLQSCDFIIGEERKVTSKLLRLHGITGKDMRLLNEHSNPSDLKELIDLCQQHMVCLVSDCGTPGFCDPGADLVHACRKANITVSSLPGPSSLANFIALLGQRLTQFRFAGFIPQESSERVTWYKALERATEPVIFMDTPYRLKKVAREIGEHLPKSQFIFALDMTKETEAVFTGNGRQAATALADTKAEFMACYLPS